ncbi:hypothetical protein BGX38DRAFT_261389 [Terfezia claveryi]|nr:hypothetical protein BGX38DRAFT_261389 [Terfezia claveryi]
MEPHQNPTDVLSLENSAYQSSSYKTFPRALLPLLSFRSIDPALLTLRCLQHKPTYQNQHTTIRSTGNFISTPTPCSVGLLAQVLSIYPTLRPILSYSHRADIIYLAPSCRTLNSILRDSVSPLCPPFPRCTWAPEFCHWCRAIVCTSCKVRVQRQHKPYVMDYTDRLNVNEAMVIGRTHLFVYHVIFKLRERRTYHRGLLVIQNTALWA